LLLPLDIYASTYDRSFWGDGYNIYWELDDCNSPFIWIMRKRKENKKEFYGRNRFRNPYSNITVAVAVPTSRNAV